MTTAVSLEKDLITTCDQQIRLMLWLGEVQAPQPGKWFQVLPLWQ